MHAVTNMCRFLASVYNTVVSEPTCSEVAGNFFSNLSLGCDRGLLPLTQKEAVTLGVCITGGITLIVAAVVLSYRACEQDDSSDPNETV